MSRLSPKQSQILEFIKNFINSEAYAPSLQEIADHFGLASASTAYHHVCQLEAKGLIKRSENANRSIEVASSQAPEAVDLPLVGEIAAGVPIEAIEQGESFPVPASMLGSGENFVLRVKGDSMIEEAICDGDYVLVEKCPNPNNGETVVAILHGEAATLKKFHREGPHIRLQPANEEMSPIMVHADKVEIRGVVRGLIRQYKQ